MYKKITLIAILLFSFYVAKSTNPPAGSYTLSTQAEVDEFILKYAGLTKITGQLILGSIPSVPLSDITDLSGFSTLQETTSSIVIQRIPAIENLDFLSAFKSANGVFVDDNDNLTDITKLSNVANTGELAICMNKSLTDLSGIEHYTTINGNLYLFGNQELVTSEQLQNIKVIEGDLRIYDNPNLSNLDGFKNLELVAGLIKITNNPKLTDCAIDYICQNITSTFFVLNENGGNCNSPTDIHAACIVGNRAANTNAIKIFPSPVVDYLSIDFAVPIQEAVIISMTGRQQIVSIENNKIDVNHFKSGVYILKLIAEGQSYIKSFVIE